MEVVGCSQVASSIVGTGLGAVHGVKGPRLPSALLEEGHRSSLKDRDLLRPLSGGLQAPGTSCGH